MVAHQYPVLVWILLIGIISYHLPHTQASTCQCTCGGSGMMGGMGYKPMPMPLGGGRMTGEFDEIDNSGIPGWGPGCHQSSGNCPTKRPLKPSETTKYNDDWDWEDFVEWIGGGGDGKRNGK